MRATEFQKKISHLDQVEVLTGAVSSMNRLLVDKGVVDAEELQKYFAAWMRQQGMTKARRTNGRRRPPS